MTKEYIVHATKEGGSWAFFEAIAIGLPIICLKNGGPDMIVTDGGGIKIFPSNPDEVINNISKGLYQLSTNAELRDILAAKAKNALLEKLTWEKMMTRIDNIYDEVLHPVVKHDH